MLRASCAALRLLALGLTLLAARGLPAPLLAEPGSEGLPGAATELEEPLPASDGAAAGAAAAGDGRGLQAAKQPLPNFEIGVPAPPKKQFNRWQAMAVRERLQELSSTTFVTPRHPGTEYVALCVVARDAHPDILEWLDHHLRLGVGKVYLWDHASDPPMQSIVQGYINAGLVEYQHFTEVPHPSGKPQMFAYDECLARYGGRHTWMGFIDVDEFLMFRDPWPSVQSLPNFLLGFQGPRAPPNANSGVAVHWIIFGSSGHEHRPTGGVLRSYTRCIRLRHAQHALVKTIVRTACTLSAEGPHNFRHNCTQPVLQTDKTPIHGARSEEPVHTRLALHHYAIKSRNEFALKMVRGSAMKRQRGWEFFSFIDDWSTEFNHDGLALWDTLQTFKHYPAITQAHLQRYSSEQHEDFWLKGADDPRFQEQQRKEEAAKRAAAEAAKRQAAAVDAGAGAQGAQAQQQQQAGQAQLEQADQQQQGQQQQAMAAVVAGQQQAQQALAGAAVAAKR